MTSSRCPRGQGRLWPPGSAWSPSPGPPSPGPGESPDRAIPPRTGGQAQGASVGSGRDPSRSTGHPAAQPRGARDIVLTRQNRPPPCPGCSSGCPPSGPSTSPCPASACRQSGPPPQVPAVPPPGHPPATWGPLPVMGQELSSPGQCGLCAEVGAARLGGLPGGPSEEGSWLAVSRRVRSSNRSSEPVPQGNRRAAERSQRRWVDAGRGRRRPRAVEEQLFLEGGSEPRECCLRWLQGGCTSYSGGAGWAVLAPPCPPLSSGRVLGVPRCQAWLPWACASAGRG